MTENEYPPIDPETVAAIASMEGKPVTVTNHELEEDVDGAPLGVTTTVWEPAVLYIPWGRYGWPERPTGDDPAGAA
jgi:hypothetical protein